MLARVFTSSALAGAVAPASFAILRVLASHATKGAPSRSYSGSQSERGNTSNVSREAHQDQLLDALATSVMEELSKIARGMACNPSDISARLANAMHKAQQSLGSSSSESGQLLGMVQQGQDPRQL